MTTQPEAASRLGWQELERIVSLAEAASLSGLSVDSLRRFHGDKILTLSPRRKGMRIKHALMMQQDDNPRGGR
jgi:hypothetical protein